MLGAGLKRRLAHSAAFNLGDTRWDADNDPGTCQHGIVEHLFNKNLKHRRRDVKIGDDAVLERTHRDNAARRAADNLLGLAPDVAHRIVARIDRDNGRLTHDNALALHKNQCIGCTQVNTNILCEHI